MFRKKGYALGLCVQMVSYLPAATSVLPASRGGGSLVVEKAAEPVKGDAQPGDGWTLGNDLVKEHFRVRSIERIVKADGSWHHSDPHFRVVLIAVSAIKDQRLSAKEKVWVEKGSLLVVEASHYAPSTDRAGGDNLVALSKLLPQAKSEAERTSDAFAQKSKAILKDLQPSLRFRIKLDASAEPNNEVLGPDGNIPKNPFAVSLDMDLSELEGLSGDDEKAFGFYIGYMPRASGKVWIWSGPVDVQLFSGAIWSTNFLARSESEKANFFKEHGFLRVDATQLFGFGHHHTYFFQSIVGAQVEPPHAIEVTGASGTVEAIRTTSSMQGDMDFSFGIVALEHLNVSIGWREAWLHSKSEIDPASPTMDQPEGIKSQHYLFLRFQEHDPKWSGSFIEFANGRDPLFRSALHPEAEERKLIRGRVSFRPARWTATSFYLEGSMSQPWHRVEGNFDESRVVMGFRIDMKNFSMTWPFSSK